MMNKVTSAYRASSAALVIILSLVTAAVLTGCKTGKGTGALAGAGLGTLIGAAAGNTEGALIGAAIGTGVGYIIGDQADQKKAKEMSAKGTPVEVAPLGGSKWKLASLNTGKQIDPYVSKVIEFRPDAHVITTTTHPDGGITTFDESYRVVGNTLIVNKPGYIVNARYSIEGNQLIINDPGFSAVLVRMPH